ncbi:MAG: hypothetical protein E7329_05845 [Clostridiales bacterium]|nr:hypothetical protein [Clostridiales bacterium]
MLYPQNKSDALKQELFQQPTSEYRGTPFWAWNCALDEKELLWQIEVLKEMGMGGFHMHCRSGMSTEYLSDDFMKLVGACVEKAREEKMLAWLYDEDRWPSGAAGGLVTKDHTYRARSMLFTPNPQEKGKLLARYAISLDENLCLKEYRMLGENEEVSPDEMLRYAYLQVNEDDPWYNNQAYLNTLDPASVKRFLEVTHDRYAECFQKDFGGLIPAIFTDEPQFRIKDTLPFPNDNADVRIPWTDDLEDTFRAAYGTSLLATLPEVFWELPGDRPSVIRYRFHDHVAERFTNAFSDQIGKWCEAHQIMLTGHMNAEPSLYSQTRYLGEAMRNYRNFQLPGIDMLCDRREYTTAKQTQSAVHQYGRVGMLSELYGVTGWDCDFRIYKNQGDWQAALGVTVRVPHLAWVSMEGEAKRDYPASIFYQSPWYKEFSSVENHFARLNTALTRGKPCVKVGVIHPIESYWLRWGPASQTQGRREEMDDRFQQMIKWMLFGLIDFDYISESLLPELCPKGNAPLPVGKMSYDAIVVPDCETLRSTTLSRLEEFVQAGGKLIFMGNAPVYEDAMPSERGKKLAEKAQLIPFTSFSLLRALEDEREIDVHDVSGARANALLYQMREEKNGRWLFLCNGENPKRPDLPDEWQYIITVKGQWKPTIYDTATGDIRPCPCRYDRGNTVIPTRWHGHDSLLLWLEPGVAQLLPAPQKAWKEAARFRGTFPVTLSEPNALLLDQAEYAYDGGPWKPKEEILRIERRVRAEHHLIPRNGAKLETQPWVVPADTEFEHFLSLRFKINSEIECNDLKLAIERPATTEVTWNGEKITAAPNGYFTDKSICTIPLPMLHRGENELILRLPLGNRCGAEWCYLLGDFGVKILGDEARITAPVRELAFGNYVDQGLPFYTGNVTYHLAVDTEGDFAIQCTHFRNPLLTVEVDGKRQGEIAYSPYIVPVSCEPGKHSIDITAYGHRHNAFGVVHLADESPIYLAPIVWRLEGHQWTNEYRLKRMGVLSSPIILK